MSSFLTACELRAADVAASPDPPLLVRQATLVFREDLLSLVMEHLLLPDLVSSLAVDKAFRAQTRLRIGTLWPTLSRLFDGRPFYFTASDVLLLDELSYNRRQMTTDDMGALAAAVAIGAFASLETLRLGGNWIGDGGMHAFASAVAKGALGNLKELYLSQNRIGDAGLTSFAEAIGASGALAQLETLYFQQNEIGEGGMQAFASAVASGSLPSLKTLFVDDGPLGTEHTALKEACEARGIDLPDECWRT